MATETRRVIFRHPRGIYETVEVTGEAFGEPYRYTETVRTPKRDERRMVNPKEDAKARCEAKRNASATPEERQKIVELYEAGNSILAIARAGARLRCGLGHPACQRRKNAVARTEKERIKS